MYFITTKRMLEVCFSAHPNIQYRTLFSAGGLHCQFSGLLFLSDSRLIYKMGRRPTRVSLPIFISYF